MNNLKHALESALSSEGINKQTFARQRNMEPCQVSAFLKPDTETGKTILGCIFKGWETPGLAHQLLHAHIKDLAEDNGIPIEEIINLNQNEKNKSST